MTLKNSKTSFEQKHRQIAYFLTITFAFLFFIDFLLMSVLFSWADWVATLLFSLFLIMPSYISNAAMVILGGGKPIDGGRNFIDGRRLFGDHKTWRGLILGPLLLGIPISIAVFFIFIILWPFISPIIETAASIGQYKLYTNPEIYRFYFIGGPLPIGILVLIIRIIFCSYGAAIGDLVGSCLKRRLNIASGAPFWIVDQLDFAVFSILFAFIPVVFFPTLYYIPDLNIFIFLMILTPAVSIIANTVAYIIGMKDVPW
ncbi:MAG: CDP-2,3-bis-(O-geranylgeranyl)-sn-glycerol synthase [Promethearchaeota archaeon]|nr:MAG: CDP-2,3-bis-(O-geranylgeranyl)-sn-glycerol synthase [Candidatus Lokiarchaeota archaeon]